MNLKTTAQLHLVLAFIFASFFEVLQFYKQNKNKEKTKEEDSKKKLVKLYNIN